MTAGIVSLLFCGICLKHYAYHNMSRRTQLTTRFTFSLISQLSENFIFIYLGLSLFTEPGLEYKPLFILVTVIGICIARWCAVFPLSAIINWVIRYRARRRGVPQEGAEEIPWNWRVMIFWAGLRGAVGVALAAGLVGPNGFALRATVLVVVVLTVIIFGGTTSRMLEILGIKTGVVEEIDSDDEFDIEPVSHHRNGGAWARKNGQAYGHTPNGSRHGDGGVFDMKNVSSQQGRERGESLYSTGHSNGSSPTLDPELGRRNSSRGRNGNGDPEDRAERGLLSQQETGVHNPLHSAGGDEDDDAFPHLIDGSDAGADDDDDLDLPPAARRSPQGGSRRSGEYPQSGARRSSTEIGASGSGSGNNAMTARGAINQILNATSEDAGNLFNLLDEGFLKPHLLLDPGGKK